MKINELNVMHFCVISMVGSVARNASLDKMKIHISIESTRLGLL